MWGDKMIDISDHICDMLRRLGYKFEKFDASQPYETLDGSFITPPLLEFIKTEIGKNKFIYIYGEIIDNNKWEDITTLMEEYQYSGVEDGNIIFIFKEGEYLPTEDFNIKIIADENMDENLKNVLRNINSLKITKELSISSEDTEAIKLKVLDENNDPVPNAIVFVKKLPSPFWKNIGGTNHAGEIDIALNKGRYYIQAKKIGYLPSKIISINL